MRISSGWLVFVHLISLCRTFTFSMNVILCSCIFLKTGSKTVLEPECCIFQKTFAVIAHQSRPCVLSLETCSLYVLGVFHPNTCGGVFYRPQSQAGDFSRYRPFHVKTLPLFPAPSLTRPFFLLCHAAMCLCIPYQLDKRRERSYSLLPLTFTSCFYNLSKARCLHSGTGFVLKKQDNGERHNVIS